MSNCDNHNQSQFASLQQHVSNALHADMQSVIDTANLPAPLSDACLYAVMGGGKRVRPLLVACAFYTVTHDNAHNATYSTTQAQSDHPIPRPALNDACRRAMLAVEFIHTYSLIHDDLPCMDDDDLRRGRPTCHIAFDEATALLAGDVLQTLAFEVLAGDTAYFTLNDVNPIDPIQSLNLLRLLSPSARRMVAGQMSDLNAEDTPTDTPLAQSELEAIHRDKTGALIEASVLMGAMCADNHIDIRIDNPSNLHKISETQLEALSTFARNIGLAFQVQDDILDVTASTDVLGKPAGSDEKLDKSTYVKLMGVDDASAYAKTLFADAKSAIIQAFGEDNALIDLADWLWARKR